MIPWLRLCTPNAGDLNLIPGWVFLLLFFGVGFFFFLVAQMVKNLPAMQETQVQSLGQEDPLEKRMTTHSSILAWRIPWAEEPGKLQSLGVAKSRTQLSD